MGLGSYELKIVFPNLYQHGKFSARERTFMITSTIISSTHTEPRPSLNLIRSEHLSFRLFLTYNPLRRQAKPTAKTVITWPNDALFKLKDCVLQTD